MIRDIYSNQVHIPLTTCKTIGNVCDGRGFPSHRNGTSRSRVCASCEPQLHLWCLDMELVVFSACPPIQPHSIVCMSATIALSVLSLQGTSLHKIKALALSVPRWQYG